MIKIILHRILYRYKLSRTFWPYLDGYGVLRVNRFTGERLILDTGLTKDQAKDSLKELRK